MPNRYLDTPVLRNKNQIYENLLENRGLKSVTHYGKFKLNNLSLKEVASLNKIGHLWHSSDKMYKLADKYYGNSSYWWVIAWFNKKPMDCFYEPGQEVYVPMPLEDAIYLASREDG